MPFNFVSSGTSYHVLETLFDVSSSTVLKIKCISSSNGTSDLQNLRFGFTSSSPSTSTTPVSCDFIFKLNQYSNNYRIDMLDSNNILYASCLSSSYASTYNKELKLEFPDSMSTAITTDDDNLVTFSPFNFSSYYLVLICDIQCTYTLDFSFS